MAEEKKANNWLSFKFQPELQMLVVKLINTERMLIQLFNKLALKFFLMELLKRDLKTVIYEKCEVPGI